MAITKLKHHNKCTVHIVYGRSDQHTASLECVDTRCKRKHKFIQWLSHTTANELKDLGVKTFNHAEVYSK